jgi:hypothetical protein
MANMMAMMLEMAATESTDVVSLFYPSRKS